MLRNLSRRSRSLLATLLDRAAGSGRRRPPIGAEPLESRAMLAGVDINGGLSWTGWTSRGRSAEPALYASGGTTASERYEVFTVTFAFEGDAISDAPVQAVAPAPLGFQAGRSVATPFGSLNVSAGAFAPGNTIFGIGVRATDTGSIAGFKPTIRFDLDNDSYKTAAQAGTSVGLASFSQYSEQGDFSAQFEGANGWRGSTISVQAGNGTAAGGSNDTVSLPGGVGSGTSYDFAFRAFAQPAANAYQMFFDMTAIPQLYGNTVPAPAAKSVYGTFFPNKAGVGPIGDRVTVSLNGLGSNNVVFGADLTLPPVDLDVDSNNDGTIDPDNGPAGTDDRIEEDTSLPGVILPVGGSRAKMVVDVPQGRTATLAFVKGADKVRVYRQEQGGTPVLDGDKHSMHIVGGGSETFWIEAVTPSSVKADIAFALTPTGRPASNDIIHATAVYNVVSIKAIDDVAHEQYQDTGTFVITRESGPLDTIIPVQIVVAGDADYGSQYTLTPALPDLGSGPNHRSNINLLPGVDRLIVTLTPLRENRDNHVRKAVLQLLTPHIPLYAVAKGYDEAEVTIIPDPQQGDLLITGRITYQGPTGIDSGTTLTLGALPVRGATVEIRDQGIYGDSLLATAYTDDNGTYEAWISSKDPTPGGGDVDPFVIVVAQSAPENIAVIAHEVSIPGGASPASKVFADNVVPRGPGRAVLDGAFSNTSDTGANAESRRNAAFSVFDALYSYTRYHITLPGVGNGTVRAQVGNDSNGIRESNYRQNTIQIHLDDRFEWDVIGHEYGHFAHDHAGVGVPSGDHSLTDNLRFRYREAYGNHAWRLAFTEGFATYFSIVAQLRTPKPPSGVAGYGDTAYLRLKNLAVVTRTDLEAEGPSIPAGTGAAYGSLGEDNEVSIFRTLWDLYDPANDDPIGDIGELRLWELITGQNATAKTYPQLRAMYRDVVNGASIERIWDVGKVLAVHSVVPSPLRADLNGATTSMDSIDKPPTFVISALYGTDETRLPAERQRDQQLFETVEIGFYTENGFPIAVSGSTAVAVPSSVQTEWSWTPTKQQWREVLTGWLAGPLRWSVVARTRLYADNTSSRYESHSVTLAYEQDP